MRMRRGSAGVNKGVGEGAHGCHGFQRVAEKTSKSTSANQARTTGK